MRRCPQCRAEYPDDVGFCPNDGVRTELVTPSLQPASDGFVGRVIDGRYRVEKLLGEGGMGVVYTVTHAVLGKRMALKVLRAELAKDADVVQRFIQEAQSATSIGHPNIVDISDFGKLPDGSVYFVMEYLDGESLTRFIERGGSIPAAQALHIACQVADALGAAHARGIVHRDLKPDNIQLVRQGADTTFVKVLDFGIAKVGGGSSKLTKTGMVFGTPHYMSPEQAAGQAVDHRSDIYALGVILYEMFAGRVPFDGDTHMGVLSKHMFEQPIPPSQVKGVPLGAVEDVILRCLAKKPEARPESMAVLAAELQSLASGGAVQSRASGIHPPTNLADLLEPRSRTEMRLATPPAPRSPLRWLAVLGVVSLAAVGSLFVVSRWMGWLAPPALAESEPVGTAPSRSGPGRVPPPAPVAAAELGSGALPPTPTASAPTASAPTAAVLSDTLTLTSDPPGAEVFVDGALLGSTPLSVPRPSTDERTLRVRLRGHAEGQVILMSTSPSTILVTLHRSRVTPSPQATPTARPSGSAQTEIVNPWE